MIAGIDFSLTSTGITIYNNGYKFYAVSKGFPKKFETFVNSCLTDCIVLPKSDEEFSYCINWVENIMNILKENNVKSVAIEGYSYGSTSSSFTKIAEVTGLLKYMLTVNNIEFITVQPTTAKKLAGNGRYNKSDMFQAFLNNVLNDDELINTQFYKEVKDKNSNVKPIEDVIDSYFVKNCCDNLLLKQ